MRDEDPRPNGVGYARAPVLYHTGLTAIVSKMASYKSSALWAVSYRNVSDERALAVAGSVRDEDEAVYVYCT